MRTILPFCFYETSSLYLIHCQKQSGLKLGNCQTKSNSLTIRMKALDEYILIIIFVLLLKRVNLFLHFFKIHLERHASERVNENFQKECKEFLLQ